MSKGLKLKYQVRHVNSASSTHGCSSVLHVTHSCLQLQEQNSVKLSVFVNVDKEDQSGTVEKGIT